MIRRLFRKMFRLALVLGAAAAVYKVVQARKPSPALPEGDGWPPTPKAAPKPPERAQAAPVSSAPAPARQAPPTTVPATEASGNATPVKPKAAPVKKAKASAAWVEPVDGDCPATHPVKGKMTSLIYHLPGMTAYARTRPDRCYRDEDAAQADGLRKAKR
ncbi:MAG TPA: hypothetical protein VM121_03310 [Acidimicrobiales bacterium]|nr:hypothetical protein [Acidimicrobiales bacterium]